MLLMPLMLPLLILRHIDTDADAADDMPDAVYGFYALLICYATLMLIIFA